MLHCLQSVTPNTLRRAFRIVLAIGKWFAIVSGCALLVVFLVNARDEELTPETRALAEYHSPSVPDAQNAYLALVGFDAPAGADPVVAGAHFIAESDAAAASDPSGHERVLKRMAEDPEVRDEGRLKFIGSLDSLPDPLDRPSLPQALDHAGDIRTLTDANAELVARYVATQKLPAYARTSLPDIIGSSCREPVGSNHGACSSCGAPLMRRGVGGTGARVSCCWQRHVAPRSRKRRVGR